MRHVKARLTGILLILIFGGLTYYNWLQLESEGSYSLKTAAFGPVGVVVGIFLLLFPRMGGKPKTTGEKLIGLIVFLAGLAVGLFNWYLMDPGYFGK